MDTVGIALLGAGTVGAAVAARLTTAADLLAARAGARLELRHIVVRDTARPRPDGVPRELLTTDATAAIHDPAVQLVVEVMGGLEPTGELVARALAAGRTVVTANKALLAQRGPELVRAAGGSGAGLWFEAAAGGGMPAVALLRDNLQGDRVSGLEMVINGTTNFIIGRLAEGVGYGDALAETQRMGWAEAEPSADVDGHDAAAKLCLLAWLAFGRPFHPDSVSRVGIRALGPADLRHAADAGYTVRLVASARRQGDDGVALVVEPTWVPRDHPLADLPGGENAICVEGDMVGTVALRGSGAGGEPTGSAVVSDIVRAARCLVTGAPQPLPSLDAGGDLRALDPEEAETAAVLRVEGAGGEAADQVAQLLEDRGVRVGAVADDGHHLLVLTRPAPRAGVDRAIETLDSLPWIGRVTSRLGLVEARR